MKNRIRNLRALVERYGTQKALAEAIGREPNYISRCLKGTKSIGDEFADHIENALGLSYGWLDHEEPGVISSHSKAAKSLIELMTKLDNLEQIILLAKAEEWFKEIKKNANRQGRTG